MVRFQTTAQRQQDAELQPGGGMGAELSPGRVQRSIESRRAQRRAGCAGADLQLHPLKSLVHALAISLPMFLVRLTFIPTPHNSGRQRVQPLRALISPVLPTVTDAPWGHSQWLSPSLTVALTLGALLGLKGHSTRQELLYHLAPAKGENKWVLDT